MNGEQVFKALWTMTHGGGWQGNIPMKTENVVILLDWMAQNMKKSLLTKLGIGDITAKSEKEVEQMIAADQEKRTRIRKAAQVKYGKKGSKGKGKKA